MRLMAKPINPDKGTVYTNVLNYLKQGWHEDMQRGVRSDEAEYDACYYEVFMDESILDDWIPTKLDVKITAKTDNVNAYIYGGRNRKEATQSMIANNKQVEGG